ncbi:MAG: hypothetical protein J3R72DRAFT_128038 [Linnemannia gamsii]|nr:MAG: hypothetical protein J3R72DRAFT_128038 [Linnemannia gamsii]
MSAPPSFPLFFHFLFPVAASFMVLNDTPSPTFHFPSLFSRFFSLSFISLVLYIFNKCVIYLSLFLFHLGYPMQVANCAFTYSTFLIHAIRPTVFSIRSSSEREQNVV